MHHHSLRARIVEQLRGFLPPEEAEAESWRWLEEGLGLGRAWLLAHGEEVVPGESVSQVDHWLERRRAREPWAYILGWSLWRGRRFKVTRDTLIPRPETELVLEAALEVGRRLGVSKATDVGTGSGILAITLALETDWGVSATDISRRALRVAEENAASHGALVRFSLGDLLASAPDPVGLVVSNPPYVDPLEAPDLQPELGLEPSLALFGGEGGLAVATELLREAHVRSAPGIVMEIGAGQGPELEARARARGWRKTMIHKDFAGHHRVLVALA
ncbi:MAG: peptide chain release factor N(5)-glutamine methyltransferase [Acidobacteria bacterium]|nr:peptide chain release factor N(5)-glutamine methyltransferase [Acidobacteriota bacterium]